MFGAQNFSFSLAQLMMKVVPKISYYYYNRVSEVMKGRGTTKRNKQTTSDKLDSASSSDKDEDNIGEEESELPKKAKRRRRLIEEDNQDYRNSTPLSASPDHTYKTSDEKGNGDQEQECDMELEVMLLYRSTKKYICPMITTMMISVLTMITVMTMLLLLGNVEQHRQEVRITGGIGTSKKYVSKGVFHVGKLPGKHLQIGSQLTSRSICFESSSFSLMKSCLVRLSRK